MLRVVVAVAYVVILLLYAPIASGQTQNIKRLKERVNAAINDRERTNALFALCDQGYTLHPDTLIKYAEAARRLAIKHMNLHNEAWSNFYISGALTTKGLIDSSLNVANRCVADIEGKMDDPILLAALYNQKGRCFMRKNQYKEAIDMGLHVISTAEKGKDVLLQIKGKTLLGWAYLEMGQTNEALKWHLAALHTTDDSTLLKKYGILFANLALNYDGLGKTDSAFYYIKKAVDFSRSDENLFALSNSLAIEAQLYVRAGLNNKAEAPLKEVVQIRRLIGDPFYIVSDMCQLSLYYAHNGEPAKGIALCNEGIIIARKYRLDTKLFFLYQTLAENYKMQGSMDKYADVLQHIIALKDTVYEKNSAQAMAELHAKYDLQKKENLIIRQQAAITQQQYIFVVIVALILCTAIIATFVFREYKRKQKEKLQLRVKEEKLFTQQAVSKAEENERKRIAADLHDNMGAYVSAISANVDYYMHENRDNQRLENIKANASEIMMNLRDTIWVLNKNSISITNISDRFKLFMQKISNAYPHIQIEIKEEIYEDVKFPPEQSLNILRIMQEGLNNALKHSKATAITISIKSDDNLKITIADNGSGFAQTGVFQGNGLANMNLRAKESGLHLSLKTLEPTGTEMELSGYTIN